MNSQKSSFLLQKLAGLIAVGGASAFISLPAMAQTATSEAELYGPIRAITPANTDFYSGVAPSESTGLKPPITGANQSVRTLFSDRAIGTISPRVSQATVETQTEGNVNIESGTSTEGGVLQQGTTIEGQTGGSVTTESETTIQRRTVIEQRRQTVQQQRRQQEGVRALW